MAATAAPVLARRLTASAAHESRRRGDRGPLARGEEEDLQRKRLGMSTDFHAYAIERHLFSMYEHDARLEALVYLADIETDDDDLELSHQLADDWLDSFLENQADAEVIRKHVHELIDAGERPAEVFEMGSSWRELARGFARAPMSRALACCFEKGRRSRLGPEYSVLTNPELGRLAQALQEVQADDDMLDLPRLRAFYTRASERDWVVVRLLA